MDSIDITGNNDPGQPAIQNLKSNDGVDNPTINLDTPNVVLAIGAHPDDIEFGCGATLAKWASAGAKVYYSVCTDGSKGTWNVDADTAALITTRQSEQRIAAAIIGASIDVYFLGAVDGELENTREIQRELVRIIRTVKPDVVLTHDPWKMYRLHPDHRNAGQAVCDAIVAARDPHFLKDLGIPHHRPKTLLMWEAQQVHHVENVSEFVDVKLRALEAHESQFESTMKVNPTLPVGETASNPDLEKFRNRIRARLSDLGANYGFPAAEVFSRISDL